MKYLVSKIDNTLKINSLYYLRFSEDYFDIYIDEYIYIGWTNIKNLKYFITLAEWRDKQINSILDEK